jgi:hypothetical protein
MIFTCDIDYVHLLERCIAEAEGSILWNRRGETRLIPAAMIRNAKQSYDSWLQMHGREEASMPSRVQRINWEDCLALPQGSAKVQVSREPTLDVVEP